RAEHRRRNGVVQRARVLNAVQVDGDQVRRHARRQRADVVTAQHARAAQCRHLKGLTGAEHLRPALHALEQPPLPRLAGPVPAIARAGRALNTSGPCCTRWSSIACRASPSMCPPSLLAEPSTPRPTRTPCARYARIGATPEPRRMLLFGQCATPVSVSANSLTSSSFTKTECACHT